MTPRTLVRSSILLAVCGAIALFFTIGIRRMPAPAPGSSPASAQPSR